MRLLGLLLVAALTVGVASAQDCETGGCAPQCGPEAAEKIDCEALCTELKSARRDIAVARGEFKRLARLEQRALKAARKDVFKQSPQGQAMAPALSAAADLLEATGAAEKDTKVSALCSQMAASYRAMARALDKKDEHLAKTLRARKPAERAGETYKRALALLQEPATERPETAASWRMIKQGDPRYRAFARNMKLLQASLAAMAVASPKGAVCVDGVKKLEGFLQVHFAGVATERPQPPPAPAPT